MDKVNAFCCYYEWSKSSIYITVHQNVIWHVISGYKDGGSTLQSFSAPVIWGKILWIIHTLWICIAITHILVVFVSMWVLLGFYVVALLVLKSQQSISWSPRWFSNSLYCPANNPQTKDFQFTTTQDKEKEEFLSVEKPSVVSVVFIFLSLQLARHLDCVLGKWAFWSYSQCSIFFNPEMDAFN